MVKPTYVNYILNYKKEFKEVFNYRKLPMDNSSAEKIIKPFVVNKHRCRFYVSPEGANGAAIIYLMMLSAQENKLTAYMYMKYVLERLPNTNPDNEEEQRKLLSYSNELPSYLNQLSKSEIKKLLKEGVASKK